MTSRLFLRLKLRGLHSLSFLLIIILMSYKNVFYFLQFQKLFICIGKFSKYVALNINNNFWHFAISICIQFLDAGQSQRHIYSTVLKKILSRCFRCLCLWPCSRCFLIFFCFSTQSWARLGFLRVSRYHLGFLMVHQGSWCLGSLVGDP